MKVRILKPSKSTMQSGRAGTKEWMIDPDLLTPRAPDAMMGWASSADTLGMLKNKLFFTTKEEAVAFAQKQGWEFTVVEPKQRKITPRNYLDNFKWIRPQDTAVNGQ